jgi:hypothetical protein
MATLFSMTQEDLDIMTGPQINGVMSSTGTTTGSIYCDNNRIHCCFKQSAVIVNPTPGVYQLQTESCTYDIEIAPSN